MKMLLAAINSSSSQDIAKSLLRIKSQKALYQEFLESTLPLEACFNNNLLDPNILQALIMVGADPFKTNSIGVSFFGLLKTQLKRRQKSLLKDIQRWRDEYLQKLGDELRSVDSLHTRMQQLSLESQNIEDLLNNPDQEAKGKLKLILEGNILFQERSVFYWVGKKGVDVLSEDICEYLMKVPFYRYSKCLDDLFQGWAGHSVYLTSSIMPLLIKELSSEQASVEQKLVKIFHNPASEDLSKRVSVIKWLKALPQTEQKLAKCVLEALNIQYEGTSKKDKTGEGQDQGTYQAMQRFVTGFLMLNLRPQFEGSYPNPHVLLKLLGQCLELPMPEKHLSVIKMISILIASDRRNLYLSSEGFLTALPMILEKINSLNLLGLNGDIVASLNQHYVTSLKLGYVKSKTCQLNYNTFGLKTVLRKEDSKVEVLLKHATSEVVEDLNAYMALIVSALHVSDFSKARTEEEPRQLEAAKPGPLELLRIFLNQTLNALPTFLMNERTPLADRFTVVVDLATKILDSRNYALGEMLFPIIQSSEFKKFQIENTALDLDQLVVRFEHLYDNQRNFFNLHTELASLGPDAHYFYPTTLVSRSAEFNKETSNLVDDPDSSTMSLSIKTNAKAVAHLDSQYRSGHDRIAPLKTRVLTSNHLPFHGISNMDLMDSLKTYIFNTIDLEKSPSLEEIKNLLEKLNITQNPYRDPWTGEQQELAEEAGVQFHRFILNKYLSEESCRAKDLAPIVESFAKWNPESTQPMLISINPMYGKSCKQIGKSKSSKSKHQEKSSLSQSKEYQSFPSDSESNSQRYFSPSTSVESPSPLTRKKKSSTLKREQRS